MEANKEFNKEFKEEVNKLFADLFKEIGNNRQQLATKVLGHQRDINKELNKNGINAERKKGILSEIARTVKMAAQQLPHLKIGVPAAPVTRAKEDAPKKSEEIPTVKKKPSTRKPEKMAPAKKKK